MCAAGMQPPPPLPPFEGFRYGPPLPTYFKYDAARGERLLEEAKVKALPLHQRFPITFAVVWGSIITLGIFLVVTYG